MNDSVLVVERRYRGPEHSGNGGYVCGRLAGFIGGPARVRLRVPPPLDRPMAVRRTDGGGVRLLDGERVVAEAWPGAPEVEIPRPPTWSEAEAASRGYPGFVSHRFPTCFVCGTQRAAGDGLRIFAGPVGRDGLVACTWIPGVGLAPGGGPIDPAFVWAVLDCPGGFAFAEPEQGTILLGELSVEQFEPVRPGARLIVAAWEIAREGRKHHTGTALFTEAGRRLAVGRGIWLEVPGAPGQP